MIVSLKDTHYTRDTLVKEGCSSSGIITKLESFFVIDLRSEDQWKTIASKI